MSVHYVEIFGWMTVSGDGVIIVIIIIIIIIMVSLNVDFNRMGDYTRKFSMLNHAFDTYVTTTAIGSRPWT